MSKLLQIPPVYRCAEAMWTPEELAYPPRRRLNGTYNNGPGNGIGDGSNERVINGVALVVFAGVLVLIGYWICH